MSKIEALIRDVPDFPKPGILFKDITPVLANPEAFSLACDEMLAPFINSGITKVIGIESRGFIFGTVIAQRMGTGFVPIRKPGKLPWKTISAEYELEYGTDKIQMHQDAVTSDDKVLIIDDLLATGGTMSAACKLVNELGAIIVGVSFLIELGFLEGRCKIKGAQSIHSVITY